MLEDRLSQDLKQAMLAHDTERVETLRSLKGAILNVKVADGTRDQTMSDDKVVALFQKQAKQRQESADLFKQGGNLAKAESELSEKMIIESYLPKQMSEDELVALVDGTISRTGAVGMASMGLVIGEVKKQTAGTADGATIAKIVKERLASS